MFGVYVFVGGRFFSLKVVDVADVRMAKVVFVEREDGDGEGADDGASIEQVGVLLGEEDV